MAISPFIPAPVSAGLPTIGFTMPATAAASGLVFPQALVAQMDTVQYLAVTANDFAGVSGRLHRDARRFCDAALSNPRQQATAVSVPKLQRDYAAVIAQGFSLAPLSKIEPTGEATQRLTGKRFPAFVYLSLLQHLDQLGDGVGYFNAHLDAALKVYDTAENGKKLEVGRGFKAWMNEEGLDVRTLLDAVYLGLVTRDVATRMLTAALRIALKEEAALNFNPYYTHGRGAHRALAWLGMELSIGQFLSPFWVGAGLGVAALTELAIRGKNKKANADLNRTAKKPLDDEIESLRKKLTQTVIHARYLEGIDLRTYIVNSLYKDLLSRAKSSNTALLDEQFRELFSHYQHLETTDTTRAHPSLSPAAVASELDEDSLGLAPTATHSEPVANGTRTVVADGDEPDPELAQLAYDADSAASAQEALANLTAPVRPGTLTRLDEDEISTDEIARVIRDYDPSIPIPAVTSETLITRDDAAAIDLGATELAELIVGDDADAEERPTSPFRAVAPEAVAEDTTVRVAEDLADAWETLFARSEAREDRPTTAERVVELTDAEIEVVDEADGKVGDE